MKKQFIFFSLLCFILISACKDESTSSKSGKRILVYAKTAGYKHSAIPNGKAAIKKLGKENDFDVDATEDSSVFTEGNLKKYAAVVFLNTQGMFLTINRKLLSKDLYKRAADLLAFIQPPILNMIGHGM